MVPNDAGLASQIARSQAGLHCRAAEVQRLVTELPRVARNEREGHRFELAQQCRRLLTEASDLVALLDQSERQGGGTP